MYGDASRKVARQRYILADTAGKFLEKSIFDDAGAQTVIFHSLLIFLHFVYQGPGLLERGKSKNVKGLPLERANKFPTRNKSKNQITVLAKLFTCPFFLKKVICFH